MHAAAVTSGEIDPVLIGGIAAGVGGLSIVLAIVATVVILRNGRRRRRSQQVNNSNDYGVVPAAAKTSEQNYDFGNISLK
jgi:hypothetical protein